ncbi:alpha-hydroxy acid oxidase [Pseudonocardia sp. KRD291]|uniref:alpha-hydroxy acid oxidase n=1 Tax=Pseudonocardia sp. KRD291 TaxID=2792007 RepID=UPI001C4A4C80|nr:alpha-hydroxy acid oxidase [Pseudonocardia sp. KRD291]MBW0101031.1 alpha-hydroxy-acid oxidizing protein [Pseudonocardia sp. KRD291]
MLLNTDDYRKAARRRLPRTTFDVIDGGAGDEVTLRANRDAFDDFVLRPRALADVRTRDLSTTVLGQPVSMPILLAPCGFARMAHRDAEPAVARAAAAADTVYSLSTVSSYPLEDVAASTTGALWFQLYPPADRDACAALVARASVAGYRALVVTIDGATSGLRERDKRNRLTIPIRVTPRMVAEAALRPRWALDFLRGGVGRGSHGVLTPRKPVSLTQVGRALAATARPVTLDELAFIRDIWPGPLVVKGVLRGEECRMLSDLGVDAVSVSNHGGRQLDRVPAAVDALPEVVSAVGDRMEVFVDGGFRRGTDVAIALALGARAVMIGRPYLHGLSVGGQDGVSRVLEIMRAELDQTMCLLGATRVKDLDSSAVVRRDELHGRLRLDDVPSIPRRPPATSDTGRSARATP